MPSNTFNTAHYYGKEDPMNRKNIALKKTSLIGRLIMGIGMILALFQSGEVQAAMIEDEGTGERHLSKKIIGGIVMKVRHLPGTRNISLLVRETKIGQNGHPLCNALTGRLLSVESVGGIYLARPARLKSSLVVMESPDDLTPRDLKPGECVSIAPDDIDRATHALHSSIRIAGSSDLAKNTDRLKEGFVELWTRTFPTKGAVAHHWSGHGPSQKKKMDHASILPAKGLVGQPA